jgi:hypothetical protein
MLTAPVVRPVRSHTAAPNLIEMAEVAETLFKFALARERRDEADRIATMLTKERRSVARTPTIRP